MSAWCKANADLYPLVVLTFGMVAGFVRCKNGEFVRGCIQV